MRQILARETPPVTGAAPSETKEAETVLVVTMLYQDALTRRWATELWDRVAQFAENRGVVCKAWSIKDLAQDAEFIAAVQTAARADVVVVAVRDTGDLPLFLHVWIDAWMPRRAGREGALVALIGVPTEPDAQVGCTHHYLKAVAARAGLDYLPRERSLPGKKLLTTAR